MQDSQLLVQSPKKKRPVLRIARISENAQLPVYGSEGAAGADLFASEDCIVPAKGLFSFYRFFIGN